MGRRVLIIGGSPCSGKSTIAERIAQEFGAVFFKVDDYLNAFMETAAAQGKPLCKKSLSMTPEEIWMREPKLQCAEEFGIYRELAEQVWKQLEGLDAELIVTEGAAYTPTVMRGRENQEYIAIVPSPEFQITHYRQREWVPFVLEGCSDKEKAFENWMERDVLFAKQVRRECEECGVPCLVNDGSLSLDEMYEQVKELFSL